MSASSSTNNNNNLSSTSTTKTLILLRGISGSGKSTLASELLKNHGIDYQTGKKDHIFSTDDYFVDPQTGKYNFDGTKLGKAHQWNQKRASDAMKKGINPIIIDNTNTQKWEAKPYVQAAKSNSYEVQVTEPTTPWAKNAQELAKRNEHGVPLVAIERMLERWETDFSVEQILASQPPKRK